MANAFAWIPITTSVFVWLFISSASATTDASDVSALQDLYKSISHPSQLTGWKSKGGDPCEEQWKGISCDGSSIIYIKLNGLNLGGYLGEQLNLMNLKQLDLSSNHIQGEIPSLLPPNATNIDLSCNDFNMTIPYTLNSMIHLHHLEISATMPSGSIGNVFTSLHNLKQMDLSFNNFSGDLPTSFMNLTNLTGLYLQNNKFTGSVVFLANLPLLDLNIENNHFNGIIPQQLLHVPNLWIGGNKFRIGPEKIPHPLLLVWITVMISITYRVVLFNRPLSEFAYVCLDLLMDIASLWLQYLLEMCHLSGDESSYLVLHCYAITIAVLVIFLTVFSMREHGPGATVFGIPLAVTHIVHTAYTSYLAYVGSPPSQLVRKMGIDISKAGLPCLGGGCTTQKIRLHGMISRNGSL